MNCSGHESSLWRCPCGLALPNCGHHEDSGVICSGGFHSPIASLCKMGFDPVDQLACYQTFVMHCDLDTWKRFLPLGRQMVPARWVLSSSAIGVYIQPNPLKESLGHLTVPVCCGVALSQSP